MSGVGPGTDRGMSEHPEEADVERRAELLPEEEVAGSDDPHAQAEAILEESAERTQASEETGAESVQTSTPDERPQE